MKTNTPKFTVGICSSEREAYLEEAVSSVILQNYDGFIEVIIADDNSKSFSPNQLALRLKNKYSSLKNFTIKVVQPEINKDSFDQQFSGKFGEAAMRNLVINFATAEFIIWVDDDDILLPEALKTYEEHINSKPDSDIFYPNLYRTNELLEIEREYQYRVVPRNLIIPSLLMGSIFPNGGSCIKKKVFEKVGLYDTTFEVATDYHFWAKAALNGTKFEHIPVGLYLYRSHASNAALDKEDERFFKNNGRVIELILRNSSPESTFPFFEWKNDPGLADFQVLIACLILSERNREIELSSRCLQMLSQESYKKYKSDNNFHQIIEAIKSNAPLSFDSTAQLLAAVIQAGTRYSENSTKNAENHA
ncbi:MAG TPA: glycosyltransferase [Oligoflexia bacterium]|nr:glycosyltransferase [Oligoflexia bacterium]HMP48970.1 glycosyltransferase [Oligoflexia bacterium]